MFKKGIQAITQAVEHPDYAIAFCSEQTIVAAMREVKRKIEPVGKMYQLNVGLRQ